MSVSARARAFRAHKLATCFPALADMRVLDLGGTSAFWQTTSLRPSSVTVVNLDEQPQWPGLRTVQADACTWVPDQAFDLVVSNSLIEHVGGVARRRELAAVIRGAAARHWVQTPYRYFPVEPHWRFPGFQFLPLSAQVFVTRHWTAGHIHESDYDAALAECTMVELLSATEMRSLFPGDEIWFERLGGLPKSIVAIRS